VLLALPVKTARDRQQPLGRVGAAIEHHVLAGLTLSLFSPSLPALLSVNSF
jgi:hypothetical protein